MIWVWARPQAKTRRRALHTLATATVKQCQAEEIAQYIYYSGKKTLARTH
jgi:hypothetical protein